MQEPRWKVWLSYLGEWHIETVPSDVTEHLYVSLRYGRYQLSTAKAVYSFADLYSNFRRAFEHLNLDLLPGKSVLILGLGLGSVPYMLEAKFHRKFEYTAIELDESVVYLANKYVLQHLQSSVTVYCTDAAFFMAQNEEQFDLIAMDVFVDDVVPPGFEAEAFLEDLKRALSPGGLILYNRLAENRQDKREAKAFLEEQFKPVFPEALYLDVGGNYMLLNHGQLLNKKV